MERWRNVRVERISLVLVALLGNLGTAGVTHAARGVGKGEFARIDQLRCRISSDTQMILGPDLKMPLTHKGDKKADHELLFTDLYYGAPRLSDPARPGRIELDLQRHSQSLELTYRQVYYTENYEYYPRTGEVIYTEIYSFHYASPQIFVAKGHCEAQEKPVNAAPRA